MRESLLDLLGEPSADHGVTSRHPLSLHVLEHEGDYIETGILRSERTGRWWWVAGGVPRLLPPHLFDGRELEEKFRKDMVRLGVDSGRPPRAQPRGLAGRTIDSFGDEWQRFRDWGHLEQSPGGDDVAYRGGLWDHTLSAFRGKTFLSDRIAGKLCLDAGCGNGRFTAAALHEGASSVVSVDLGWGVDATQQRFRHDPRVHVVQASLFELPIHTFDVAFSIGVLMHTGDALSAFTRIAMAVPPSGLFAVRLYHKGNSVYETLDRSVRAATTRLSPVTQRAICRVMASIGRAVNTADERFSNGLLKDRAYRLFHTWPTFHHNVDWWSAPVASHHTLPEVLEWAFDAGLETVQTYPQDVMISYPFWEWPEALTALFHRPASVAHGSLEKAA